MTAPKRRMGLENAASRFALMDAVEAVMREEGYAALSARAVARRAGLNYQLVFYYFGSMDDLLLTAYRRRTERVLSRIEQAVRSDRPLHAFWAAWRDPADAALSIEYMALANHNAAIRAETIAFGERIRRVELERLTERLSKANPDPAVFTPFGVIMALNLMGGILGFESALGISGGHQEIETLIDWCLERLEPEPQAAAARTP
jgi:AcrR family transcriptional regulator